MPCKKLSCKYKTPTKELMRLYNWNLNYIRNIDKWNRENNKAQRRPAINESLSEGIVQLFINEHENRECLINKEGCGDLICNKSLIEVKCFSSKGPITLNNYRWSELYIIDATRFEDNYFEIYKCKLSNLSKTFQNIQINNSNKYSDFYYSGRKCKISFKKLKEQLKYSLKKVFSGSIHQLEK